MPGTVTRTATIPNGTAVSGTIDLSGGNGLTLVGILMPASWTAAALGFQITLDGGTTWTDVTNTSGALVQIASPTGGSYLALDPADFASLAKFRLHSAASGATTDVNQGADRAFTLVARVMA